MSIQELKDFCQQAIQKHEFQQALSLINQALELDNFDCSLYATRAGIYNCIKKYDDAILDSIKSTQLDDQFSKAYLQQGFAYYNLHLYDQSIESYQQAQKLEPSNPQITELIKKVQKKQEILEFTDDDFLKDVVDKLKYHEVFSQYLTDKKFMNSLELLSKSPQLKEILIGQNQKLKEAIDYLFQEDKSLFSEENESNTQENQGFFNCWKENNQKLDIQKTVNEKSEKGKIYFNEKNFSLSLQCYQEVSDLVPQDLIIRNSIVLCLIELKQIEKAQEELNKSFDIMKQIKESDSFKLSKLDQCQAIIFYLKKDFQQSLKFYKQSVEKFPNKQIQQEIAKIEKIIDQEQFYLNNPVMVEVDEFISIGNDLFRVGKYDHAVTDFNRALSLDSNNAKALVGLSNCYVKLQDLPKAMQYLDQSLMHNNKNTQCWIKKGYLHYFQKQFKEAQVCFEFALEINYNDPDALKGLEKSKIQVDLQKNKKESNRIRDLMQNDEIKRILLDEEIRNILNYLQNNPQDINSVMSNEQVGFKLQKLIDCGLLDISQKKEKLAERSCEFGSNN